MWGTDGELGGEAGAAWEMTAPVKGRAGPAFRGSSGERQRSDCARVRVWTQQLSNSATNSNHCCDDRGGGNDSCQATP